MKYLIVIGSMLLGGCGAHPLAGADDWLEDPRAHASDTEILSGRPADSIAREPDAHETIAHGPVGLDELLRIADQHNPQIAEARAAVGIAASQRWQAELYPNPSLEFETEETGPADGGGTRGIGTVAIVQPIPVGRSRGAAIDAATAEQRAKLAELDAVRLEVLGDLRIRYIELLFLQRSFTLNTELSDIVDQAVQVARNRFKVQASPEAELIKAQINAARLDLDRMALEKSLNIALARITSLSGGIELTVDQVAGQLPEEVSYGNLEDLQARLSEHPRLTAARHRVEAARQRVDEARGRTFDEVGLRAGYARDYANDNNLLTASVSVPLPLFDGGKASVLAAVYGVVEQAKRFQTTRNQLLEALNIAWHEYRSTSQRLEQQRQQITEPALRAWTQTQAGYRAGHDPFLDLLDAQRTLIDARSMELDLLRDIHLAQARIWKLLGSTAGDDPERPFQSKQDEVTP